MVPNLIQLERLWDETFGTLYGELPGHAASAWLELAVELEKVHPVQHSSLTDVIRKRYRNRSQSKIPPISLYVFRIIYEDLKDLVKKHTPSLEEEFFRAKSSHR